MAKDGIAPACAWEVPGDVKHEVSRQVQMVRDRGRLAQERSLAALATQIRASAFPVGLDLEQRSSGQVHQKSAMKRSRGVLYRTCDALQLDAA